METTKFCEYCDSKGVRHKKVCTRPQEELAPQSVNPDVKLEDDRVQALQEKLEKQAEQIKMLTDIADKGRMFNYESKKASKKPTKIKLSVYDEKILIGWRTMKDRLIKNPTTGLTVGEEQEYEVMLLDKEDKVSKAIINGYVQFSALRYDDQIDVNVVGTKEDYEGKISFDVILPDGRQIELASQFVN